MNSEVQRPSFRVENIQAILSVKDMDVSRAFYVGILGFKRGRLGKRRFYKCEPR